MWIYIKNKKVIIKWIIKVIWIVITLIIFVSIIYNFKYINNWDIYINTQEKILKSIVKIEYRDNNDNDWIWSWIIFSKDWLLLTNNHVIEDEDNLTSKGNITICILETLWSQESNCTYKGKLIIRNSSLDLAVIKIKDFTTNNYIHLFSDKYINTSILWEYLEVYGYPIIWGESITITKWIVSWFDSNKNIKSDVEINWGNSWWGAFISKKFIWIPTNSITSDTYWKIWFIITKDKIYSWFASILKSNNTINYSSKDFNENNLIYKWYNVWSSSSIKSNDYLIWEKQCLNNFWINSYHTWNKAEDSYLCKCKKWYDFWTEDNENCILINK